MEKQFVSFSISGGLYCIDIMDVKEVVRENNITPMPDSPFFVEGIMNLRGIVIPVISVRKKLGLGESAAPAVKESKKNDKLIIVSLDNVLIGFMVDSLDRVFTIDTAQIQASERIADSSIDRALIQGVARTDDRLYLILDIKKILDIEEKTFIRKEIMES